MRSANRGVAPSKIRFSGFFAGKIEEVLPVLTPTLLKRKLAAFNHPDWIFELKYDGFRSLAYVADGGCKLASRNRNLFSKFGALCTEICTALGNHGAVIDGEIVCLDDAGVPQFGSGSV